MPARPPCRTTWTTSRAETKGLLAQRRCVHGVLLKEYWGEHATADNDYCFDYLPRINGDHSTYRTVMDMIDGKVFGYFLLGQNPAVGSATAACSGWEWPTWTGWWCVTW